jgi:transposase-like protein
VGGSWRVDETYIKVRGCWVYLYRAVVARGQTVDFRLSPKRDVAAAKAFFGKAFKTQGRVPRTITLDGYQASHRAVRELGAEDRKLSAVTVRSCQYLNNIVKQDHRGGETASAADACRPLRSGTEKAIRWGKERLGHLVYRSKRSLGDKYKS